METISAREIDRYIFDKNYLLVDVRNTGLQWKVSGIRPEEEMRRECMVQGMNRLT